LVVLTFLTGHLFRELEDGDHTLGGLWHHWDVLWYIRIADHGYRWQPPPVQSDLAFFPLYPLTMHLLAVLSPLSAYAAGTAVTGVSFAIALYLLHRLVSRDYGRDAGERAVLYLAFFPTALFFFAAYSEALYLLTCLGCVYALRLRRWWAAGLCGMAAALTRQLGLLLLVPFLVEYVEAHLVPAGREGLPKGDRVRLGRWALPFGRDLLAALLIPAGTALYMVYLQVTQGDALLFLRAQAAWQRSLQAPWWGVARSLKEALDPTLLLALRTQNLIDLSFLGLFLLLLVLGVRRLPRSYTAYAAAVWLAILINPATGPTQPLGLLSVPRFGVTVFPSFVVLGLLGRHRVVDRVLLIGFVALLTLFTVIFLRNKWVA
jgi:hypothetical protein